MKQLECDSAKLLIAWQMSTRSDLQLLNKHIVPVECFLITTKAVKLLMPLVDSQFTAGQLGVYSDLVDKI